MFYGITADLKSAESSEQIGVELKGSVRSPLRSECESCMMLVAVISTIIITPHSKKKNRKKVLF